VRLCFKWICNPEVLDYLAPYLTAYKIDLKTMQDSHYRSLGGVLQHVLDTIKQAHDLGLWVEVVTLVIPGFNDRREELWEAGRFLASVSPDIPWHLTAFHPDYQQGGHDEHASRDAAVSSGDRSGSRVELCLCR
jgi:pyruvate-formate lyase-activating enzyme